MDLLFKSVFLLLIASVFGNLNVVMENVTIEYVDQKYVEMSGEIHKIKQKNALNAMVRPKIDFPENTKILAKAFRWVLNDYCVEIFEIQKTLKNMLEMESFDLQSLFVRNARPPIVWPLQKGVTYRIEGWTPDSSKFPQTLPTGKYKIQVTTMFPNKTKISIINYIINIH